MNRKQVTDQALTGIVVPANWDAKGKVTGISLQTFDEKEYLLEFGKSGKGLMAQLRKKVEVSGSLFQTADGRQVFRVRKFKLLTEIDRNIPVHG